MIFFPVQHLVWKHFIVVTTNTHPQRFFSLLQAWDLVDVNQPLPWFFMHWPREDSFPVSRALGGKCRCLSRFCNILLQDLTPLHVKITRSTNLLSVCWRKLKLSTYLNTVSYNHSSFLGYTRSQLFWVLASLGFYMISRSAGYKIHFRKQPPLRGNLCPLAVWHLSFLWIYVRWQFVHGSLVFTQSNK